MKYSSNNTLVVDIARDVIAEIAPQEIPIFPAATEAYFAKPAEALKQLRSKDSVLGFGMDSLAIVLTPAVLHILSKVFEFLTDIAKKAVEGGLSAEIGEVIKAMFKKSLPAEPTFPSVLTKEQIGIIHSNVLLAARKLRLPTGRAHALADAVTAQFVLPKE